ncbi:hypothetical protein T06_2019, partial [Trichinella sp. T6]
LVSSSNHLMTIGSTQWLPSTGGRQFNYFTQHPCTNSLICFFWMTSTFDLYNALRKPNSDCIKIVENAFEM